MPSTEVVLITGANRGLGLETARQLLKKGYVVMLSCRDSSKGAEAVRLLRQEGLDPDFVPLDISDPEQIQNVYRWISDHYGHLDVLINNAAVTSATNKTTGDRMANTILNGDIEDFKATFDINVWGTLELTRAVLPLLKKSNHGRIINLSSELGSIQLHATTTSPIYHIKKFGYSSSKTLVNLITIYLQEALKDTNISVYAVSPGWVKTEMGTAAAMLEIPEGAGIIVRAVTENMDRGSFFTHGLQEIPW
ncbi:SDR family NAD(P)-dependent oxidoreductase [Chitinophaga qingshengii]|uniref:SDR family NAD(P)-dependent oxidoreductase n=1 Tax=Chitinophaga qingshengii TaxID=1569794 RepID=A0ABR7TRJ5_9BACT|nr:SDR family NAD(P)-dependent oxidoreductase [Chitinophaga qingshengii]MBC9933106.1 SDR family NAD(P)-dependent oxidoreductase [Chitinophaga qingshengii]